MLSYHCFWDTQHHPLDVTFLAITGAGEDDDTNKNHGCHQDDMLELILPHF